METVLDQKTKLTDLETATLPGAAMETSILRAAEQTKIESPFCGHLRKILPPELLGKTDGVIALGLQSTKAHFHQTFSECYMVLTGTLKVALYDRTANTGREEDLSAGDVLLIAPGTGHKVITGSRDNQVLVLCSPPFDPADETSCAELEKGVG